MSKTKKNVWIGLACGLFLIATIAHFAFWSGFSPQGTTYLYIDNDDNLDSIENKLSRDAAPQCLPVFCLYAKAFDLEANVHTGRYEINESTTALKLAHHIRSHAQTPVRLVVPSVRTLHEMAGKLSRQLMADSTSIAEYLENNDHATELGFTPATLPALFIPNTYEVYWDTALDTFFNRLKREHDTFWNENRKARLASVSQYAGEEMTQEKVVTLASIVDSETANNNEKSTIAALYMNRLRKGMPLQSDPTVIFATQDFSIRRVRQQHLDLDSPYNTYRNRGLPPGPIRIASIAGIDAVLNYTPNDYLYMCAKEDFSGTHRFAASFAEHQHNARLYTKALNQRGIH